LHAASQASFDEAKQRLLSAHQFSQQPVEPLPLFYGLVKWTDPLPEA
jgi:hypothetical protein